MGKMNQIFYVSKDVLGLFRLLISIPPYLMPPLVKLEKVIEVCTSDYFKSC